MNYRLAYAIGFHSRRYRSEVEAVFLGWEITDVEPSYFSLPKLLEVI